MLCLVYRFDWSRVKSPSQQLTRCTFIKFKDGRLYLYIKLVLITNGKPHHQIYTKPRTP